MRPAAHRGGDGPGAVGPGDGEPGRAGAPAESGKSSYEFDPLGRLLRQEERDGLDQLFTEYDWQFDLAGQMEGQPIDGQVAMYDHDESGQLTSAPVQGVRTTITTRRTRTMRTVSAGYALGSGGTLFAAGRASDVPGGGELAV